MFAKLFISCQVRQCNLEEFFKYENQAFPASLSVGVRQHACQKSQLIEILTTGITLSDRQPERDAIIMDGSYLQMPQRLTPQSHLMNMPPKT